MQLLLQLGPERRLQRGRRGRRHRAGPGAAPRHRGRPRRRARRLRGQQILVLPLPTPTGWASRSEAILSNWSNLVWEFQYVANQGADSTALKIARKLAPSPKNPILPQAYVLTPLFGLNIINNFPKMNRKSGRIAPKQFPKMGKMLLNRPQPWQLPILQDLQLSVPEQIRADIGTFKTNKMSSQTRTRGAQEL